LTATELAGPLAGAGWRRNMNQPKPIAAISPSASTERMLRGGFDTGCSDGNTTVAASSGRVGESILWCNT
jgi:hypothetical protein